MVTNSVFRGRRFGPPYLTVCPVRTGASRGGVVVQDTTPPRKQSTSRAFTFWRGNPRRTRAGKGVVDQAIRQMRSIRSSGGQPKEPRIIKRVFYRSNLRQIQSRPSERYQSCIWPTAETFAIEKRLKMRWREPVSYCCVGPCSAIQAPAKRKGFKQYSGKWRSLGRGCHPK